MKYKLKLLWNKIKPLDYSKNPIGSLKLEVLFWLSLIYLSTTFTTLFEIIFIFGYSKFLYFKLDLYYFSFYSLV